ncbi:cytochrome P450 2C29-like [Pelobates cultripes]|uniref:Cytochrome P450 2C29-like n=1 Tax=Pelobates cultripes TaxID=61616 RepID=A0AAD1S3E1_PELCU|nr:cytochrome P450 2C29-like [Pelobates cultripes]
MKHKVYKDIFDIHHFVRKQISRHRETLDINSPRDLLDYFLVKLKEEELNTGSIFNDTSLIVLMSGILAAATDTTSSSLKFCLVVMTHFPEIQVLEGGPTTPVTLILCYLFLLHMVLLRLCYMGEQQKRNQFLKYTWMDTNLFLRYLPRALYKSPLAPSTDARWRKWSFNSIVSKLAAPDLFKFLNRILQCLALQLLKGNQINLRHKIQRQTISKLSKKYGPVFTVWKMTEPIVVLCGYEVVKDALVNHGEQFSQRPRYPTVDIYSKGYAICRPSEKMSHTRSVLLPVTRFGQLGWKCRGQMLRMDVARHGTRQIMGIFIALSLFLSILVTVTLFLSYWKQTKMANQLPPGPPPLPLLGNPSYVTKAAASKYPELHNKYGPVFTVWKMTEPIVVLCGYEVVKDALMNHGEQFKGRPWLALSNKDPRTNGISFVSLENALSSECEFWRPMRRFLLSALRNFGMGKKIMEDQIHEELCDLISAIFQTGGKAFNPTNLLGSAVNSTISYILFGEKLDYQDPKLHELIMAIRKHIGNSLSLLHQTCNVFPVLLKLPFINDKLYKDTFDVHNFVRKQISRHRESVDLNSPRDFIDYFLVKIKEEELKTDSLFNDTSLEVMASGIMAAATDTTSTTLKFCLICMTHFPEIQGPGGLVRREHENVSEGEEGRPGLRDRPQLPYTNAVIHECQRIYDLAPIAHYHALSEDTQFRGFMLPKGTTVIPFLSSVLFDPTQWETPENFNPGHFLDDKGQFKANPAFMPFSAGLRMCLGENLARMELFLFISALLQKFTFTRTPGSKQLDCKSLRNNKPTMIVSSELCAVPRSTSSVTK